MRIQWFTHFGWLYRPISVVGWLLTILTLTVCIWVFLVVDRQSHSVSDTLMNTFPYVVIFIGLWGWTASKTARKD